MRNQVHCAMKEKEKKISLFHSARRLSSSTNLVAKVKAKGCCSSNLIQTISHFSHSATNSLCSTQLVACSLKLVAACCLKKSWLLGFSSQDDDDDEIELNSVCVSAPNCDSNLSGGIQSMRSLKCRAVIITVVADNLTNQLKPPPPAEVRADLWLGESCRLWLWLWRAHNPAELAESERERERENPPIAVVGLALEASSRPTLALAASSSSST